MAIVMCRVCGQAFEAKRSDAMYCVSCKPGVIKRKLATRELAERHPCPTCGREISRRAKRCRPCDNRRRVDWFTGEDNPNWSGGRHKRKRDGYIELLVAPNKRRLEHRVVWEDAHGPIARGWVIHHLNGIKDDNRLENLTVMPRKAHGPREHVDPEPYERRIRELEEALNGQPRFHGGGLILGGYPSIQENCLGSAGNR